MIDKSISKVPEDIGKAFIQALAALEFQALQACFAPLVHFRAMVPSTVREAISAAEAITWFQKWFGEMRELQLLDSSCDQLADHLHIAYRMSGLEGTTEYLVEQQAYCTVTNGEISAMSLLCSGFRPIYNNQRRAPLMQSSSGTDAFYDAGNRGCADGPLDEIADLLQQLAPGQRLHIHALDPSVMRDLPAWCRMVGHTCEVDINTPQHFLVTRK